MFSFGLHASLWSVFFTVVLCTVAIIWLLFSCLNSNQMNFLLQFDFCQLPFYPIYYYIIPIYILLYPSRLLWPELQSCGSIGCREVCLILNIMELRWRSAYGAQRAKQINAKNSTVMSPSRNHDQVAHDNSHPCCEQCRVETIFLLPTNQTRAEKEA